jgi:hypothetical protein
MTKEVAVIVDILVALKSHPLLLILYMLVIRRGLILIRLEIITEEGLVTMSTDLEVIPLLVKALVLILVLEVDILVMECLLMLHIVIKQRLILVIQLVPREGHLL